MNEAFLEVALNRLGEIAADLQQSRLSQDARDLASRVTEGRFYLACVGQFKRGKSTLLNALLGERLLPTGITPVTSVPIIVRYGTAKRARVRSSEGAWREIDPVSVAEYVSEESNSENHKNILAVEIFCPSPLLASGMCLVDTPGLGSVFAGNTSTTEEFLPHIDAAILVIGADPPISGAELESLGQTTVQPKNLLAVLNKSDKSSAEEREASKTFARRILEGRFHHPIGSIYEISAEEILNGAQDQRDWRRFLSAIDDLAAESAGALVAEAGRKGVERISGQLSSLIAYEAEVLRQPIAESEARIARLREAVDQAQEAVRDLDPLLKAEHDRLASRFLTRRGSFLANARPVAAGELEIELSKIPRRFGPAFRTQANQQATQIAERHIRPWLKSEQAAAESDYTALTVRFTDVGNSFLRKFAAEQPHSPIPSELTIDGFASPSHFSFEQFLHVARPASPVRYLADIFLGAFGFFSTIEADAQDFLSHLLEVNSMRVHSDMLERLEQSRAKLQSAIRAALNEAEAAAHQSLTRACEAKSEGEAAVSARLEWLRALSAELAGIGERVKLNESTGVGNYRAGQNGVI
jgi:GTPase Era involved in 16S rRNA processing